MPNALLTDKEFSELTVKPYARLILIGYALKTEASPQFLTLEADDDGRISILHHGRRHITVSLTAALTMGLDAAKDRIETLEFLQKQNADGIGRMNVWLQRQKIGNLGDQVVDVVADYLEQQEREAAQKGSEKE